MLNLINLLCKFLVLIAFEIAQIKNAIKLYQTLKKIFVRVFSIISILVLVKYTYLVCQYLRMLF